MKTILFLLSYLLGTNIVYSQLTPVLIEPCNDPRFVWRCTHKKFDQLSVFFKSGNDIYYTTSLELGDIVYFETKGKIDEDSLYIERKRIIFEEIEFKDYFEHRYHFVKINLNMDSLNYFNEMKNTKGMAYLLNQYLEPNKFLFRKVDLLFIYFLFLNCIPVEEEYEFGDISLSYDIQEWYPELFLELIKTRRTPTKYEEIKERLKNNPYD